MGGETKHITSSPNGRSELVDGPGPLNTWTFLRFSDRPMSQDQGLKQVSLRKVLSRYHWITTGYSKDSEKRGPLPEILRFLMPRLSVTEESLLSQIRFSREAFKRSELQLVCPSSPILTLEA